MQDALRLFMGRLNHECTHGGHCVAKHLDHASECDAGGYADHLCRMPHAVSADHLRAFVRENSEACGRLRGMHDAYAQPPCSPSGAGDLLRTMQRLVALMEQDGSLAKLLSAFHAGGAEAPPAPCYEDTDRHRGRGRDECCTYRGRGDQRRDVRRVEAGPHCGCHGDNGCY